QRDSLEFEVPFQRQPWGDWVDQNFLRGQLSATYRRRPDRSALLGRAAARQPGRRGVAASKAQVGQRDAREARVPRWRRSENSDLVRALRRSLVRARKMAAGCDRA